MLQQSGTFTFTAGHSADTFSIGYSAAAEGEAFGSLTGNLNGYAIPAFWWFDHSGDDEIRLIITGTSEASTLDSITYTGVSGLTTLKASDATIDTSTSCTVVYVWPVEDNQFISGNTYTVSYVANIQFNCCCDEVTENETLSALRRRMLVRLGYSAQADTPPPGMADLVDDFLRQAQRFLYRRYKALRLTRMFTWTMAAGQRFYDVPGNDDTCDERLDPNEVEWCGFADLNGVWLELIEGIPPEFYTSVKFQGYPSRYEIRQCIEVFPAPAAAYTLRIKGRFGLTSFTADDDVTTIDSELVFAWALATAKAHYGQSDATTIFNQVTTYLRDLNAGTHLTRRYVPGTSPSQPWTQPKFLPIGNS